jgi:hypothetical protein
VPKAGVRQNPLLRWTQTVVERRAAIALRVAVVQDLSCTSLCNKPPQFRWITRLGRLEDARAQALDIHPVSGVLEKAEFGAIGSKADRRNLNTGQLGPRARVSYALACLRDPFRSHQIESPLTCQCSISLWPVVEVQLATVVGN